MRIIDWSSDVCSSDLQSCFPPQFRRSVFCNLRSPHNKTLHCPLILWQLIESRRLLLYYDRSEEHTSELQSLMRISYAVFCLKKKTNNIDLNIKIDDQHIYPTDTRQLDTTEKNAVSDR